MVKAIVFDMDGVLFDTEHLIFNCWKEIALQNGINDIDEVLMKCIGTNMKTTEELFYKHYGSDFEYDKFSKMAHEAFLGKVEEDGVPIKEGVYELLAFLKKEGVKVGLASSTTVQGVHSRLKAARIDDYFQVIIGGDMVTHSKPHPEIYLRACEELGVKPERTIAIEDSHNGVRSAAAAGMEVFMVPDMVPANEEMEKLFSHQFNSLLEVKTYLEQDN